MNLKTINQNKVSEMNKHKFLYCLENFDQPNMSAQMSWNGTSTIYIIRPYNQQVSKRYVATPSIAEIPCRQICSPTHKLGHLSLQQFAKITSHSEQNQLATQAMFTKYDSLANHYQIGSLRGSTKNKESQSLP